jgi:hypothetical protein
MRRWWLQQDFGRSSIMADLKADLGADIVAKALLDGDAGTVLELSDMMEVSGTKDEIRRFMLQLVFALLPSKVQDQIASEVTADKSNKVVELFPRDGC